MTLNTDIYITGTGVTAWEVYDKVNDLLGIPSDRLFTETPTSICNRFGQGFPARVGVYCGEDGALVVPSHGEWCNLPEEGPCTSASCVESYHVHVNLDTSYNFVSAQGWDCSRLHAYVILSLAEWLEDKGCTVRWTNEFRHSVHDATDTEAFKRFLQGGVDAANWFHNVALPHIEREGGLQP